MTYVLIQRPISSVFQTDIEALTIELENMTIDPGAPAKRVESFKPANHEHARARPPLDSKADMLPKRDEKTHKHSQNPRSVEIDTPEPEEPEYRISARHSILASLPLPSGVPDDALKPIIIPAPFTLHEFLGNASGVSKF